MRKITFPSVLRLSSAAVLLAMAVRYFFVGAILAPPFVTVVLLLLLSFSYSRWPRTSAAISLVPGLLIPVLVLIGYLRGNVELALVVFDWILFGWIVWNAANELRRREPVADVA